MKLKIFAVVFVVCIVVASLAVYFVVSSSKSNNSLVYNFSTSTEYNSTTNQYYGGSLHGWNASGLVSVNQTEALTIYPGAAISRQFRALSPEVTVSFIWIATTGPTQTETMTMVIYRQLNGVYNDLTFNSSSASSTASTYKTAFDVANGTLFTVELTPNNYAFVNQVELWNAAEVS